MAISKIRYQDGRTYLCDDCKKSVGKFQNYPEAGAAGWAVSRDRKKCYCPTCAPDHRHTGRRGAPVVIPQPSWVPAGMVQTTINFKG